MRLAIGLVLGFGSLTVAGAQDAAPAANAPGPAKPAGWLLLPDKPYSGVREYDRDQKKDGRTLRTHETTKYWRDSTGRLRTEVSREGQKVVWSYLTDPAAKMQYRWNNELKIAYVTHLGEPIPARDQAHPLQAGELRKVTVTVNGQKAKGTAMLLEPKTIDGQATIGSRQILYSDPEQKIVLSTTERWYQPEYHVTLEEVITDEQYGHRVFHFKSFKPEEPKADLFQVPKGLTLKEAQTPDTDQFE